MYQRITSSYPHHPRKWTQKNGIFESILKNFGRESNTEMEFLHRDEFEQKYAQKFEYPVILQEDKNLSVAISQAELNEIKTLDELISQVKIVNKMPGSS